MFKKTWSFIFLLFFIFNLNISPIKAVGTWLAATTLVQSDWTSKNWQFVTISTNGERLVAADGHGNVFISSDTGKTWSKKAVASNQTELVFGFNDMCASADNMKIFGVANHEIYSSNDGGITWSKNSLNYDYNGGIKSIACSADGNRLIVLVSGFNIFTSSNGGISWSARVSNDIDFWSWNRLASSANGSKIIASSDSKVYISSDFGLTWSTNTQLQNGGKFYAVTISADGNRLAVTGENAIYVSSDAGATWLERCSGHNWWSISASADGAHMAVSGINNNIMISNNGGLSWTSEYEAGLRDWIDVAISDNGSVIMAAVTDGEIYVKSELHQSICGNNIIETGEVCEGNNLANNNCQSKGFDEGILSCDISCQLDTSACTKNSIMMPSTDKPSFDDPDSTNDSDSEEENIIGSTVNIVCGTYDRYAAQQSGSGIIIDPAGYILTNKHVITDSKFCKIYKSTTVGSFASSFEYSDQKIGSSDNFDLAIIKMISNPEHKQTNYINLYKNAHQIQKGDAVINFSYPLSESSQVKLIKSTGNINKEEDDSGILISTMSNSNHGSSGSGIFTDNAEFIGTLYAGTDDQTEERLIKAVSNREISKFILSLVNQGLMNDSIYNSSDLTKFLAITSHNQLTNTNNETQSISNSTKLEKRVKADSTLTLKLQRQISQLEQKVMELEKKLTVKVDKALTKQVGGKVLLQVENNGEAWFVDPKSSNRFYMKDGQTAYEMLKAFGLGIATMDLEKIPVGYDVRLVEGLKDSDGDTLSDTLEEALGTNPNSADSDGDGYSDSEEIQSSFNPLGTGQLIVDQKLINRLGNGIVLQVSGENAKGQAWLLKDGKRYYIDPRTAYNAMRYLSLGITNDNIRKIQVGEFTE